MVDIEVGKTYLNILGKEVTVLAVDGRTIFLRRHTGDHGLMDLNHANKEWSEKPVELVVGNRYIYQGYIYQGDNYGATSDYPMGTVSELVKKRPDGVLYFMYGPRLSELRIHTTNSSYHNHTLAPEGAELYSGEQQ